MLSEPVARKVLRPLPCFHTFFLKDGSGVEIINTEQGNRFTSINFIKTLRDADIPISMDGKGAWRENAFLEPLWRSIKYEEVYLLAYASVSAALEGLLRYLTFCNGRKPHLSLDGQTPGQAYLNLLPPMSLATQPSGKST